MHTLQTQRPILKYHLIHITHTLSHTHKVAYIELLPYLYKLYFVLVYLYSSVWILGLNHLGELAITLNSLGEQVCKLSGFLVF
ncbi:hypothetical protein L1987_02567 [Smallanthus sonchifolius]|uniref:Uncharacterized protein n=1 Tax=Smallanthus sonchifolius TaxID=185202 RepID=A0ACB9K829_9ASTR|nr:hypothetical protein L1987_02567 [Smallanthus sonchifolius]